MKVFSAFFIMSFFFYSFIFAQESQIQFVDFREANASIQLLPQQNKVKGQIDYSFQIKEETDSVFLDAKYMKGDLIKASFRNAKLYITDNHFIFKGKFKKDKLYFFTVSFEAIPKQTMYFLGFDFEKKRHQIWTQGQGKYTSHWLPSIDDMNDKITFNLAVEAPAYLHVIANGKQVEVIEKDNTKQWKYTMKKPMSSYLVALAAGNYNYNQETTSSGITIYNYFEKQDSLLAEPTYRHTKQMFDFLENEIGVPYPWQNYKQAPVRDFLHSGMENTSFTIFSEQFMVDSIGYKDFNYVNVNAHELAHQWFGNLVTETEAEHHWLHEGFATYYALLAEREVFGEDYFYYKLYAAAEQLKAESDIGKGQAVLNPKASSLTFYQKGAWALHVLREEVGEDAFQQAVKNYLEKYAFQNVTTDDFLNEIKAVGSTDVAKFKKDWLLQTAFQAEVALASLKNSLFMQELLGIISLREQLLEDKLGIFQKKLNLNPSPYVVEEIALQLSAYAENESVEPLLKEILTSDQLRAQKRLSVEIAPIPKNYQTEFENLLQQNKSYILTENVLYNLWTSFPENRAKYLDITEGLTGFKNQNIHLLWKFLSMVTPEHEPENAMSHFYDLNAYTAPKYNFQIRENSFNYLYQVDRFADEAYLNLLHACFYQPWVFSKFARKMVDQLLQDEYHKQRIISLKGQLTDQEVKFVDRLLSE